MKTTILGIDPGSRCTGYGVVTAGMQHLASGVIRPPVKHSMSERLYYIYEHIRDLIGIHHPRHLVVENVFLGDNPQSALKLGQARSCALIAAAACELPVFEYSPRQVKQAVTGYGAAVKAQVQCMVEKLLTLSQNPLPDQADALAIALCHANTHAFNEKIKETS
jgi:crossover junction endodeoxyribonuclease RuvC